MNPTVEARTKIRIEEFIRSTLNTERTVNLEKLVGYFYPITPYTTSILKGFAEETCGKLGLIKVGPDAYKEPERQVDESGQVAPPPPPVEQGVQRSNLMNLVLGLSPTPNPLLDTPAGEMEVEEKKLVVEPKPPKPRRKKQMLRVILPKEIKEEIDMAISQAKYQNKIFEEWGFKEVFEKGTAITLLFYGEPGVGKTMMAQAIATDMDTELQIIDSAKILTSQPGGAERAVQKAFREAKAYFENNGKHSVVLFDECDSLLGNRDNGGQIMASQINALLTEIEKHEGIIIFTTNRVGPLDPALERRITAKINFPFPTLEQREKIWKNFIPKKAPINKDVNFKKLAEYQLGGGNIKNALLNTIRYAAYKKSETIKMDYFVKSVEREMKSKKAFDDLVKKRMKAVSSGSYGFNYEMGSDSLELKIGPQKLMSDFKLAKETFRKKKPEEMN